MLNVFVDTISIMYGQSGVRGIVRTRVLSFSLYVASLVVGVVIFPLVILGPQLLGDILDGHAEFLLLLYWPVVTVLTIASLSSLYWISTPRRTSWVRNVPGAALALVIWIGASVVLAVVPRGVGRAAVDLDLRSAGGADRGADLALLPGHRRAHRRGPERSDPGALAARSTGPAGSRAPGRARAMRAGSKPIEMRAEPSAEVHPQPRPLTPLPRRRARPAA